MSLRRTLPRWLWNFSNRLKIGCLFQTDTFFALQLEPEDAEAIYEFYKEDFLMFGYSAQEFLTWHSVKTFELWPRCVQCCQILNLSRNGSGLLLSPFRYQIVPQRENQYYVHGITLKGTVWIDIKMTGGTPEVRSDKSLALLTFHIWYFTFYISHLTFDILHLTYEIWHFTSNQWTNGTIDQWTHWSMDQWTNGPMDQWTNGPINQWTNGPMDQ